MVWLNMSFELFIRELILYISKLNVLVNFMVPLKLGSFLKKNSKFASLIKLIDMHSFFFSFLFNLSVDWMKGGNLNAKPSKTQQTLLTKINRFYYVFKIRKFYYLFKISDENKSIHMF